MSIDRHLRVVIDTIPHSQQRYNTVGDWQFTDNGTLNINISRMHAMNQDIAQVTAWKMEALLALHEQIEAILCRAKGIDELQVDAFDKELEKEGYNEEPGDHLRAPYRQQHCLATAVERMLAYALHIPWKEYEDMLTKLTEEYRSESR